MNWSSKSVAITGAGGFIGSHLVEAAARAGAKVTAITRYNSRGDDGNLGFLPRDVMDAVDVKRIDVADLDAASHALSGVDIVFNLAAFVGIPYSYENPHDTIVNNVMSTLNVLHLAREEKIGKVVQTSTSEVYGSARIVPIPETHPLQPQSPYSASKIATDSISLSYHYSYGIPLVIVRPFNTYGPRQSARAVIPSVISQALTGSDIRVGSTDTTRDFNFVGDTVRGFMLCAASEAAIGEAVNIGSGREMSIAHAIEEIVRVVGRNNRLVIDEARIRPEKSEVSRLCADISKAKQLVGYEPETHFEEGLKQTIEWMADHQHLYKPDTYNV